jgi:hypothetical protein
MSQSAANPFLFIVGCPRSGTTLLQRIVDAHPSVAVINETGWIPQCFEARDGLTPDGYLTPALFTKLPALRRFSKLQIDPDDLRPFFESGRPVAYSELVSGIFDRYGLKQGKPLVGDKCPGYVRYIATLHQLWPAARFVHLIRDGRDVVLSASTWRKADGTTAAERRARRNPPAPSSGLARLVQRAGRLLPAWNAGTGAAGAAADLGPDQEATRHEDLIVRQALYWQLNVELGRADGASIGPRLYHELRYEALVANPIDEVARLVEFLGLPMDDGMLRFHVGRTIDRPDLDAKKAWRPVTEGLRDWRSDLPPADVERVEAAAGGTLDTLGYPRAYPRPSSASLQVAADARRRYARKIAARGGRVPASWSASPHGEPVGSVEAQN